tara:strand:- start:2597 stop:3355 length:759 start_codon:yes stop_codon:yes gene_type:complete
MNYQRKSGYTLIELLVVIAVIAVIAVLIGILVPTLRHVRRSSQDGVSLANMRTHTQAVHLYAGDFRDYAPFFADPDATYSVARGGGLTVTFEYFESVEMWVVALVDRYYGLGFGTNQWDEHIDWSLFARPGVDGYLYQYSPTFLARPQYWNEDTRAEGQLGPIRMSMVRYASSKSVFIELDQQRSFPIWGSSGLAGDRGWAFSFVDGSASRPSADRLVQPYHRGEGTAHGGRFNIGVVGLHTEDGVLGRDVE